MTDTMKLAMWLDARATLKNELAELAERLAAVEDTIRDLLGDTDTADAGRWHVTYRTVQTTRVDTKKVKSILEPLGLLEKVQTVTETRVLRVSEAAR